MTVLGAYLLTFLKSRSIPLCLSLFILNIAIGAQQTTRLEGITPVGTRTSTQLITVTLPHGGVVDQVKVVTQGSEFQDFQRTRDSCRSSQYLPGQSCTVTIAFEPSAPGERHGAIVLLDSSKASLATYFLTAMASGPIATFIPGQITSVAGNSSFLYEGDGGLATDTSLFLPYGIALNAAGDLYIADTYNNRIRKVDGRTNIISTVAGDGSVGSSGDGGSALAARLNNPSFIQLDSAGNLYIADTGNNVIRVVDAFTGIISTRAGVIDTPGYTGDSGLAINATLQSPNGLAVDTVGNLYIADTGNNVIRFVSVSTGLISTVAGNGIAAHSGDGGQATKAALNGPWSVNLSSGNLYIADQRNNVVRVVDKTGVITTVVGKGTAGYSGDGGPAIDALLNLPSSIAIDAAGNMYVSDTGNDRIRKINQVTQGITTVAGNASTSYGPDGYPATQAALYGQYTIIMDGSGNLLIADVFHNRIREVQSNVALLSFPSLRVNGVSDALRQVLENDGTAPLTIYDISAGVNARVDPTTTCSLTAALLTLEQCRLAAVFAPTITGNPVVGSITLDSNATNTPGTLLLQGTVQSTDPSTVLLSPNPNPSTYGNPVLFSVQVISSGVVPTGTVTLLDGTTPLVILSLTNGIASDSISSLAVGQHTITASYSGDENNSAAISLPVVQVVTVLPPNSSTTTSLVSSVSPVGLGQSLTLSSTVSAVTAGQPVPTGSVTFMEGTAVLGTGVLVSGSATLSISTLSVGTHLLTAIYSGNSNYATSTSPTLHQLVVSANPATVTSLTSSADPIDVGSVLTLTATVAAVNPGLDMPTGTVSFTEGTTILGTGALSSGSLMLNISTLSVGTHFISAVYNGNGSFAASSSSILTQIVVTAGSDNLAPFALVVTPTSLSLQSGSHATLQIVLTTTSGFADTLDFGCGGLPKAATCTFSQNQLLVAGGVSKTLSVVLDTGNPLGAGPTADVDLPFLFGSVGGYACMLPIGTLVALVFGGKTRRRIRGVVLPAVLLTTALLSGCSSTYKVNATVAGTYTFQVFASGSISNASVTAPVQLVVTQ